MAKLINKHGRLVSVSDSRVQELLSRGFRKPAQDEIEQAAAQLAERSAKLREALVEASKSEAAEEQSVASSPVKEQIAKLLESGKKADLETALVAAGLNPEEYLTNEDRKAALQAFLGAES
jgi:hypothetical protein